MARLCVETLCSSLVGSGVAPRYVEVRDTQAITAAVNNAKHCSSVVCCESAYSSTIPGTRTPIYESKSHAYLEFLSPVAHRFIFAFDIGGFPCGKHPGSNTNGYAAANSTRVNVSSTFGIQGRYCANIITNAYARRLNQCIMLALFIIHRKMMGPRQGYRHFSLSSAFSSF